MKITPSGIIVPPTFQPGTVKPESDYEEFSRLGAKLGLPCPQAFIRLESRAQDGSLVDLYDDRSRTLNRNYWNWLFKCFAVMNGGGVLTSDTTYSAGHLTNKNTGGTIQNANSAAGSAPGQFSPVCVSVATAGTQKGIVVGTGTATESFEDVALGTIIAHGSSAGQLSYSAATFQQPSYNAGTLTWTTQMIRVFNNNSGGTIVVGETGIYGDFNGATQVYMIMRDKLSPTVSVLNAGQLTVTYTFTLVFPA